jgi:hypothetical protein
MRRSLMSAALIVSLVVPTVLVRQPAAVAADDGDTPHPPGPCADLTVPEENHSSIRLRVDQPADSERLAVGADGKITVKGILHKQATMVEVEDDRVTAHDFTLGPPPDDVAAWASSWTTTLRPAHLGANQLCVRAKRDPKRTARIRRDFTVVDLIPPSNVGGLTVGGLTSTSAKVSWNAATDNFGLAGYDVSVDGGAAHRTTVGTRSYTITGLNAESTHTVSVVAVDLAGNKSVTPATTSFTTLAPPSPSDPQTGIVFAPEQGAATASWHPVAADASYRSYLDGQALEDFTLEQYCVDASGNPASPCTAQDVIKYPLTYLDQSTPYAFKMEALAADGTVARSLDGEFTTTAGPAVVSPATTQLNASEASSCAGQGGDFYVTAAARGKVSLPSGSTPIFDGCYRVSNNSCIDAFLPPSGNKVLKCVDDITRLLYSTAPTGRGPVISSLDGVADYLRAPSLVPGSLIEPITWCAESTACTVVVEEAAEAVEMVEIATVSSAVASFLVVAAEGIGLGLVLGALLAILFPSEIAIGGLLEYPIETDTDFDTFDNWGADDGEWYNSLKIYAETVKTTKLVAGRDNIPFAWTDADDAALKRTIDTACATQQNSQAIAAGCGDGFAVYVPGGLNYQFRPMKETGTHIVKAMGDGSFPQPPTRAAWFYPAYSKGGAAATAAGYKRYWYDTLAFRPNACTGRGAGKTCDEFPFWTTNQAVNLSGQLADILPVPTTESSPQGNDLAQFYDQCHVDDTDHFIVLPIKPWVAAGGPSFGFRVTQAGTSLCLVPTP